jgi:hypothetical protein
MDLLELACITKRRIVVGVRGMMRDWAIGTVFPTGSGEASYAGAAAPIFLFEGEAHYRKYDGATTVAATVYDGVHGQS